MPVVVPTGAPVSSSTTDSTSFDSRIRVIDDPAFGGVRIKIDYSLDLNLWSSPFQCTVYRKHDDGSVYTVRGGDPYLNYTGKGWLYDQEAPLGQPVSYYVVPVDADGTSGVQSAAASIITGTPAGGFNAPDMWLVNLADPSASLRVRGTSTLSGNYNGRSDKQVVLGSPYPTVTPDTRNGLSTQITVLTVGKQEFLAMQELLKQSIIMRKSSLWERPDGYFTVDDVSYASQAAATGRGVYAWQMSLTEVGRPNTYGQTVASPSFTFKAYQAQYPLFSDAPALPFDAIQGGNVMDPNTSSLETDASQWVANTNTTIAWSAAQAKQGTHSLKMTATAAGVFGAFTGPRFPVNPNSTYTFTAWLYSPNGLVADLQLDWKDGAGIYLSSDSLGEWGLTVALTPNIWTKVILAVKPVPGSALVTPLVRLTATAGGQIGYADAMTLENI
jgi:hypothetical protein